VTDAPSFKGWEGSTASREKLVEMFQNMIEYDASERDG
jgi:hypothetical protein